jgi:Ohr subfamily peroxiredoxin
MTQSITQIEKVIYTARAYTTGGRDGGASRTSDGRLDLKLSVPGTHGAGTNPEQLFAVGWSSCFLSAIKIVAARMKVKLPPDVAIDAEVDLAQPIANTSLKPA